MTDAEQHADVGSASFQFAHRKDNGSLSRFCFNMKVGDNPDFWKARLLMHGAEFKGIIYGVIECDDGAIKPHGWFRDVWTLEVGRSQFRVELVGDTFAECEQMAREIGGFHYFASPPLTRRAKLKCVLRWLWERRPVVRWRSPLDCF